MTTWDRRAFVRALVATVIAIVVVWLVTAASDEGQLTVGVRAGRTLPLAPLCSAIGAALALGTARVREETRALEALGRTPGQTARAAALGAALPSLLVGLAIGLSSVVDVSGFYPRPPRSDTFVFADGAFTSPTLGVRITADGEPHPTEAVAPAADDTLPRHARAAASTATALAGLALALVAARAVLRVSQLRRRGRRRRQIIAGLQIFACAALTLVAFQAAAARVAPATLATAPSALLLGIALLGYRARHEHAG
ncbi:MAG TPA: hypothetical protein VLT33_11685 [Labilithrix sp.]|nr:hypothetical protein [Labilithrix sp.]